MSDGAPTPPAADTAALQDAFERVREAPGTLALYDAIGAEAPLQVAEALAAHPRHPLARQVAAWLQARGVQPAPPPTLAQIVAAHGIDDLDARLRADHQEAMRLRDSVQRAHARAERAESVASAYAAMLLLLAAVAALGWAAALGLVPALSPAPVAVPEVGEEPPAPRP